MTIRIAPNYRFLLLPRGGICIAREGAAPGDPTYLNLQIGVPPESVKDTRNNPDWPEGVPRDYFVPSRLMDTRSAMNMAELELPGLYHGFINPEKGGGPTRVYTDRSETRDYLRTMLNEAFFAPAVNGEGFRGDFVDAGRVFDVSGECGGLRRGELDDLYDFRVASEPGAPIPISDMYEFRVTRKRGMTYFELKSKEREAPVFVCRESDIFSRMKIPLKRNALVRRPDFAFASLGNSTGYDEKGQTSGFLFWANGRGILVDPPAYASVRLRQNGVLPEEADIIILTNCRSENDAGLLQRVLERDYVDVYTTRTIWNSFLRKYGSLVDDAGACVRFHPVRIGDTVPISGAPFKFFHALHVVPTLAFTVQYRGVNILYASEMHYEESTLEELSRIGVLSPARYRFFKTHYFKLMERADWILQGGGGDFPRPSLAQLNELPADLRAKTLVYRFSEAERQAHVGEGKLRALTPGMEERNFQVFFRDEHIPDMPEQPFLKYSVLFQEMKLRDVGEIQRACRLRRFPAGSVIFSKDTAAVFEDENDPAAFVYLIYSGTAGVVDQGVTLKQYHKFDFIGETGVLFGLPRTADVVARDEMTAYAVPNEIFRAVMEPYRDLFHRLHLNRGVLIETALLKSYFTGRLSWRARTDFQLHCNLKQYNKDDEVMTGANEKFLIVVSGGLEVVQGRRELHFPVLLPENQLIDHVGNPDAEDWGIQSVRAQQNGTFVLEMEKAEYLAFCKRHGLFRRRWDYIRAFYPPGLTIPDGPPRMKWAGKVLDERRAAISRNVEFVWGNKKPDTGEYRSLCARGRRPCCWA